MSGREPDVLVIGAGVCGLTTAICLAETGLDVAIRASQLPPGTTSVAAGAVWGPHLVEQSGRVTRWGHETFTTLLGLAEQPGAGVRMAQGIEALATQGTPPTWVTSLPGFRLCEPAELPGRFVTGWKYRAPVVSMPVYLGYLLDRFTGGGGRVEVATVGSLAEAAAAAPVVVNCTGAGAHDLVPDPAVHPVRGQAVVVANPGLTDFLILPTEEGTEFTYMFPHGDTVLLGGTEQPGNWSLDPDPDTSQRILARCAAIEPRLAGAEILAERVGLRPARPQVRLEAEPAGSGGLLLHNYGHGGAGVTLSWGCAHDITEQVQAFTAGG
ncbi:MAG: FAD-dependent oxidoreductase [Streptosporangiaceae bacterium]